MSQKRTSRKEAIWKILKQMQRVKISKDYFLKYPEAILKLDYAMIRFAKSDLAFKIKQADPKVWFTCKLIPEKKQLAIHLRIPSKDEDYDISEHFDIDIYFPQTELEKINQLLTKSPKK